MHLLASPVRALRRGLVATSATALALAIPATASATEVFFGTTPANDLVQFTAQAPSRLVSREPIGGLAAGETIVGLDRRPATAQLYALTSAGRLLVVDRTSGESRVIGAPIPLTGTTFGFDFNPVADRIRITSDADLNLRVHPETGAIDADGPLAYGAGDSGFGTNPAIGAAGYTFSGFGAAPAATELFGVDTDRDVFVRQDPPNAGTLATVGPLGIDATGAVHLDVAGDQTRYAAFATAGSTGMQLWRINAAGAATPAGTPASIGAPALTAFTAVGETRSDNRAPLVAVGNYTTYRGIWLDRGLRFTISCTEDCTTAVTLRIAGEVAGTAEATMSIAGTRAPRITLNARGRQLAQGTGRIDATLTFDSVDLAGNERNQVTRFSSLPGINTLS